jgi:hypothetical protein
MTRRPKSYHQIIEDFYDKKHKREIFLEELIEKFEEEVFINKEIDDELVRMNRSSIEYFQKELEQIKKIFITLN